MLQYPTVADIMDALSEMPPDAPFRLDMTVANAKEDVLRDMARELQDEPVIAELRKAWEPKKEEE